MKAQIVFWLLAAIVIYRMIRRGDPKLLLWMIPVLGLGWMAKYSIIFYGASLLLALVISRHRKLLWSWYLPVALVGGLLMRLALAIPNRFPLGIERFFKYPVRIFLFLQIARLLINELGLSLKARVLLDSSGVDYIAYTVLLMGGLSLLRDYQIRKMQHAGNVQYVALLKPFTTIVKVIVITIIGLFWANSAGYNMSTVLAGLGVGSLAVEAAPKDRQPGQHILLCLRQSPPG